MDIYSVNMTVEDYMDLEPCGSVHPDHPDVVCIKKGKCSTDWHMAERTAANRYTWIVQWGKDLEDFISRFKCKSIVGELLPIT
ncbi:hypothetical protein LCGC14_2964120 [marine sediment metagenome]|uniref:Uncharacterized protein n=1 Tax=marine sediment metagenome TaxID=412755 RepID=A0A0F8XBD7_9ZZZZ